MASIAYHRKKNGAVYVYSVTSYWDKDRKQPRNKQVCIGKLNKDTGEIELSERKNRIAKRAASIPGITATSKIAGATLLLDRIADDLGIRKILKRCFPDTYLAVLSLVYFIVQKGLALSHAEQWSEANQHPFEEPISSQEISDLLAAIGENERQQFLSEWLKTKSENDYLCYDITSISSYSEANEYVKYGYNRDGEALQQINLAMLFGQNSKLPLYYRRMPGSITDVSTLKTTLKSLDFLGSGKLHFITDRGFYSEANIDELFEGRHKFTMAIPSGRKWVEHIIDKHYDSIALPRNYVQMNDDEVLYMITVPHKWGKEYRRCYLHIYYNGRQAGKEFDNFTLKLLKYKEEIETGKRVKAHEEYYERYFFVKDTAKRGIQVGFNEEAIRKHRKRYAGFFCILSNKIRDPQEALNVYRNKDVVENSFDDLKNQLDMKRLRVHTSRVMDSRIFLQFIALIFMSSIRTRLSEAKALRNYTVREVMEHMEALVRITYSNRYGELYTEATATQRKIMEHFKVTLPT